MNQLKNNDLLEKLAELEHKQWAHWTKYMLDNLTEENIRRWRKQIETSYSKLSQKEKESDREWARKVIGELSHRYPPGHGSPNDKILCRSQGQDLHSDKETK